MTLNDESLDLIFRKARSINVWLDQAVPDDTLRALYDLMKWGPTTANTSPARLLFLRSRESKVRLKPFLIPQNVDKTMTAPVVAILGYDTLFYEHVPKLFAHNPGAKAWFEGEDKKAFVETTALRNSAIQGGYLIVAARSLGLDCGPMSGFDNAGVDAAFFPGGRVKVNFICNLGHADTAKIMPRNPRLSFDEACKLL